MDLDLMVDRLREVLDNVDFNQTIKEDDYTVLFSIMGIEDVIDEMFVRIDLFDDGSGHITFNFGKINMDYDTLLLVNLFNEEMNCGWGYIEEDEGECHFIVHYHFQSGSDEYGSVNRICATFNDLLCDDMRKYLMSIVERCY